MISVKAHAKINLALNVKEKREDNYHDIDMVMLPLELHDRIDFDFLSSDVGTVITSDDLSLPSDESNLTFKAFRIVKDHFHIQKKFRIHVHKKIPLCAGLGGGSADAAAVIKTILQMMKIYPSKEELIAIGKEVGADVPFALFNQPARCRGIGEQLEFFSIKEHYNCLIIKPQMGVQTKEAYTLFDQMEQEQKSDIDRLIQGLEKGNETWIKEEMINQLEKPAIQLIPEIGKIKNQLIQDGFPLSLMSGSGSSIFALSTNLKALQNEMLKFDSQKVYMKLTNIL